MSKHVKIVRTFPNSWYKFIVEGDATGLSDSERMIAESALSKAFPDGGDIVAARIGTKRQKYSTLVCESYSINGCPDKTEGKTFKVKVLADEDKNPKTYKQYVKEDIKTLQNRRHNAPDYEEEKSKDNMTSKGGRGTSKKGTNAEDDISLVGRVAGYEPSRFDVTARVYDEWKQVFGTELNKDKKAGKTEDGSDTITQESAALQLQKEIVKAFEADDKDRLRELRPLLPLLAWYSSKYNRHFTTLFKSMLTQGDQLKMSTYHKMVEVLPTVYDVAFGLDESEEAKQEAKKYVGSFKLFDPNTMGDTPEERKAYAKKVFKNLVYGTALPEACAETVTKSVASSQQTNVGRTKRSDYRNYGEPFVKWFNSNKSQFDLQGSVSERSIAMDEDDYKYAMGLYYLDTVRGTIVDVEEDFDDVSESTTLTQKGLETAFDRIISFDTNDGKNVDTMEKQCFNGILSEVWTAAGLKVTYTKKNGRTVSVLHGAYPGDFESFKTAFNVACESAKTKIESMMATFTGEYNAFNDEYGEKLDATIEKLKDGNGLKQSEKKSLGQFEATKSSVLGTKAPDRKWIEKFVSDRLTRMALNTDVSQFATDQKNMVGKHFSEVGMGDRQQTGVTVGNEQIDDERGDVGGGGMASTEDQLEQNATGNDNVAADGGGLVGGSVNYDQSKDRHATEIDFAKLNEDLIGEEGDDEAIRSRAEDLGLDPDRAVKIVGEWAKICNTEGGIGGVIGIAKKKAGNLNELNDADAKRYREEADKLIKDEEERREEEYNAAKDAYEDAQESGDKGEIKAAKEEFEKAKKNRKLSSKEKAAIARKVRYADVGTGREVKIDLDDLEQGDGKKGGTLTNAAKTLGGKAIRAIIRHFAYMVNPNGTEEDTYKGIPDLLVLLMHDKIMACHERIPEDSLESCVVRVTRAARPEFITFVSDICQFEKYATDHLSRSNESAGDDDKYLTSIEQMLDLIENAELDAQAKLDMLEAIELSFEMWCEKNEVVPETINPEEDADAVRNHPEDAE